MKVFLEALKTKLQELVKGRISHAEHPLDPALLDRFVDAQNEFGSQVKKTRKAR